jgi:hypothetical protein
VNSSGLITQKQPYKVHLDDLGQRFRMTTTSEIEFIVIGKKKQVCGGVKS